jgi:REP element-mobilizing transposase RayT
MFYPDLNPLPTQCANNYSNFRGWQWYKPTQSSYQALWNICQCTMVSLKMQPNHVPIIINSTTDKTSRYKQPCYFNIVIEGG